VDLLRDRLTPVDFRAHDRARPSLGGASAVYDSPRDRLVLFAYDNSSTNVIWSLSLASMAWSKLQAVGTPPSFRWGQVAIFDPVRDRMVLFGGGSAGGQLTGPQFNDVWALSLGDVPTSTQLQPSGTLPMGRQYAGCIYDPVRDLLVIHGGLPDYGQTNFTDLNDVWTLSLGDAPVWTQLLPAGTPPAPNPDPGAIYDPLRDRMVVASDHTWSLDFTSVQWTQLATNHGASPVTYDPLNDRLVWAWGEGSLRQFSFGTLVWSTVLPGSSIWYPIDEMDAVLTPDLSRGQVLDTGGFNEFSDSGPSFDTWWVGDYVLATGLWIRNPDYQIQPHPFARADHSAVVDDARARLIEFGGFKSLGPRYGNDTWAMSLVAPVAWTQLAPTGPLPPGRAAMSTVVDPANDRMVIFGGTDGTIVLNEAWALGFAGPQWTALSPSGTPPPPRQRAAAFYDPAGQRMIIFGGLDQPTVNFVRNGPFIPPFTTFNDLWALNLSGSPSWAQLSPAGTPPPPTTDPIAVFDPDRLHAEILTDAGTWALTLTDPPQWQPLDISGTILGTLGRGAAIYDPTQHRVLAMPTGTSTLWELDFTQPPLAVPGVPAVALALRGAVPNPSGPEASVAFTLPAPGPAWLELFDVAGRRLAAREVGGLGAGSHTVKLAPDHPLAPGIYLARLTRDGRALTARIAVLR